jgi:hypothetical protein
VNDEVMRMKAVNLGQQIRAEDGVGHAVKLITEAIAKG